MKEEKKKKKSLTIDPTNLKNLATIDHNQNPQTQQNNGISKKPQIQQNTGVF